jgi:hypothetical protein
MDENRGHLEQLEHAAVKREVMEMVKRRAREE